MEISIYKNNGNEKKKQQTTMKMKVTGELTEQKNCGNALCKYDFRGFGQNLTSSVVVDVADVLFLWCCWVYCLEISNKQPRKWMLADNERNKRTAETIILNMS